MENIYNRIYDNQSTISNILDHEVNLNILTDNLNSPKSTCSNKSNKTFKQLITENYTDYLLRIKTV